MAKLDFVNWQNLVNATAPECTVPVAIISLDEAQERREKLIAHGIPADWVENHWSAKDTRALDDDEVARLVDLSSYTALVGAKLRMGRIGNALSQRDAMAAMAASGAPLVMVLEDDVGLVDPRSLDVLAHLLEPLHRYAHSGAAFMCHLGVQRRQRRRVQNRVVLETVSQATMPWILREAGPSPKIWRSHAFIMSSTAVQRLVAGETPMRTGADDYWQRSELGYFDRFFFAEPGLFFQDESSESLIEHSSAVGATDSRETMGQFTWRDAMRRLIAKRVTL